MVSNEQMHILFFIAGYNEGTWSITNKPNQKPPQENTEPVVNIKQGPYLSVCYSKKVLSQQSRPLICSQTAAHAVCGEVCTSSGSSQSLSKVELEGSLPSARQNFPPSRLPAPGEGRRPVGSVPASAPRERRDREPAQRTRSTAAAPVGGRGVLVAPFILGVRGSSLHCRVLVGSPVHFPFLWTDQQLPPENKGGSLGFSRSFFQSDFAYCCTIMKVLLSPQE